MTEELPKYGFTRWQFIKMVLLCIAAIFLFAITLPPASATSWGMPNWSANLIENNSYVHQGDTIAQGYYYDISGVYGWSGILGHWTKDYDIGYKLPDDIVNLNDLNPRHVYIDPAVWKVGEWYQIDDYNTDSDKFFKGNNFVFYVLGSGSYAKSYPASQVKVTTTASNSYSSTAYVWDGNTSTKVGVTMVVSAAPTAIPSNVVTVVIPVTTTPVPPTEVPPPDLVTPRAPLPIYVSLFAILGVLLWYRH